MEVLPDTEPVVHRILAYLMYGVFGLVVIVLIIASADFLTRKQIDYRQMRIDNCRAVNGTIMEDQNTGKITCLYK